MFKSFSFTAIVLFIVVQASNRFVLIQGEEIIVFVHGLGGFGQDEMLGLGYWGFGKITGNNFVTWMQQQTGLRAFEASVGPISSNHDRACELYAQIKGVRTDYGKAHSTANSHRRMGRDFRSDGSGKYYKQGGFFPAWGTGTGNRVHFIAHSMGGQTVRYLERLLHRGSPEEVALRNSGGYNNDPDGPMSPLFDTSVDRDWIASITTIASPLDGSTLHTKLDASGLPITNMLKDLLFLIGDTAQKAGIFNSQTSDKYLYDFDLQHHTEIPAPASAKSYNEFKAWAESIFKGPKFNSNYRDLADYAMSPDSMLNFNRGGPRVYPNTRYFAMNTWQTKPCALNWNDQCPDLDINPIMIPTATIMGDLDDTFGNNDIKDKFSGASYGDNWEQNDGLVPLISSRGPTYGHKSTDPGAPIEHPKNFFGNRIFDANTLKKAQWYYFPVQRDHVQAIGLSAFWTPWFMYEHIRNTINAIKNK